jgi:hypothetical protein
MKRPKNSGTGYSNGNRIQKNLSSQLPVLMKICRLFLAKNFPNVVKLFHRIHFKLSRSPKSSPDTFSLLRIQTISPDTIQISPDTFSSYSEYRKFPPDVVQNVIGYRKVKFWLPPADLGTTEESMPCPFFVFSLVFSSKKLQKVQ